MVASVLLRMISHTRMMVRRACVNGKCAWQSLKLWQPVGGRFGKAIWNALLVVPCQIYANSVCQRIRLEGREVHNTLCAYCICICVSYALAKTISSTLLCVWRVCANVHFVYIMRGTPFNLRLPFPTDYLVRSHIAGSEWEAWWKRGRWWWWCDRTALRNNIFSRPACRRHQPFAALPHVCGMCVRANILRSVSGAFAYAVRANRTITVRQWVLVCCMLYVGLVCYCSSSSRESPAAFCDRPLPHPRSAWHSHIRRARLLRRDAQRTERTELSRPNNTRIPGT